MWRRYARGASSSDPEEGPLASGRIGQGRLAEEERILAACPSVLTPKRDWEGQRILLSAGPTQEPIDPVRYLSNRSSGKMGYAIAEAARKRGAQVVLVSGPTSLLRRIGVEVIPVETAEEMPKQLSSRLSWSTRSSWPPRWPIFVPGSRSPKIEEAGARRSATLELEQTTDILSTISGQRTTQLVIGFAAETHDLLPHARAKLASKGLDLIVANDVTRPGAGFGSDFNAATLIDRDGHTTDIPLKSKRELADDILDAVRRLLVDSPTRRHGDLRKRR